jgi:hypothetical protein
MAAKEVFLNLRHFTAKTAEMKNIWVSGDFEKKIHNGGDI